jgi:SAM-dependent methyltransferase
MKKELGEKIVRDAYEDPQVIACYSGDIGLWKAEEILIRRFFPEKGDFLDIGCGAGRTSIPLTQMGFNVIGIDLSAGMLREAKLYAERLGLKIDFQEMDAKSLDFADRSFDCALFSFNGIDHVHGYKRKLEVLREIFRVLKPGAPFMFSAHRIWSPYHIRKLIWSGLKSSFGSLTGLNTLEKEWGELYDLNSHDPQERYSSFLSSGRWKKALHEVGFNLVFCGSRYRLESHSPLELVRNLRGGNFILYVSGNFMLYVARKPGS